MTQPTSTDPEIAVLDFAAPDVPSAPSMWGPRDMLVAALSTLGLIAVYATVVTGLYWAIGMELDEPPTPALLTTLIFAAEALMIWPAWHWGPRRHGGGWARLGLRGFDGRRAVGQILLALLAIWIVNAFWGLLNMKLGWTGQENIIPELGGGPGGLGIALVLGSLVAPVAEEIFFRGFLYTGLKARWGRKAGLVISAIIFSLVHVLPGVLVPIFFMGLVLGWLYERTDSIWPTIILHGLINAAAFVAWYAVA